jgi:hypothetical protein
MAPWPPRLPAARELRVAAMVLTNVRRRPREHPAVDRWYAGARLAKARLGSSPFASAFAWQHVEASSHNTWLLPRRAFCFRPLDIETLWNNVVVAVPALSLVRLVSLASLGGSAGQRPRALEGGRHS